MSNTQEVIQFCGLGSGTVDIDHLPPSPDSRWLKFCNSVSLSLGQDMVLGVAERQDKVLGVADRQDKTRFWE